jgi:hypothetical protein
MVDRQWLGDLGLAVLLALPFAAFAVPQPTMPPKNVAMPVHAQTAAADRLPGNGRISLLG